MEVPKEINEAYRLYSQKLNGKASDFPYGTKPHNFGGEHLEVASDGKMSLISTDRGLETSRRETYKLDDLMYWIFKDQVNSMAFYRKGVDYNYLESQKIALEELGKISLVWKERYRKEQQSY